MAKLSISKTEFRALIKESVRKSIREQVVGYSAPEGDETKDQADDYLTVGQTSVAAAPDSQPEKAAADTSTRELTQQRQTQLDKDDAVTADDTGRQLQDLLDQKNEGTMRLTRKQLRKIIIEAGIAAGVRQSLTSKLYEAIIEVLEDFPGMSGAELVDAVNQMHPSIGAEMIYDFLDVLEQDGEVMFNVEEDAWSLR